MKNLLAALIASAAFLTLAAPGFAQSSAQQHPMGMSSPSAMHSPSSMMKSSSMSGSAKKSCPTGMTYTKGYTKANGTKVKGYCHK